VDYKTLNPEEFKLKDCLVAGDECVLITSKGMGTKWTKENARFRSCIVRKSDGKCISQSFPKFKNWGEDPEFQPWDSSWPVDARHKLDGCCDENTILQTSLGPKTIKEICDNEIFCEVEAFDLEKEKNIMTPILGHSIKNACHDWFELTIENGKTIKLTGEHRVWLPELNCYRKVKDLKENDVFLVKDRPSSIFLCNFVEGVRQK